MKNLSKTLLCSMVILLSLAACTLAPTAGAGQPLPTATAPLNLPTHAAFVAYPADGELPAGGGGNLEPFIEGSSLSMSKIDPAVALLVVTGDLPSPCHSLAFKVALPDLNNQIKVSLAILPPAPGMNCIQVIQTVKQEIPLGKLSPGSYTVLINGQQSGSLTVP